MKKYKIRVYVLEILLLLILFFTLLVLNKTSYIVISIILGILALVTKFIIVKKKITSISKKQVIWLMLVFSIIYLGVFYFLGLIKYNFYRSPTIFGFKTLYRFIIPLTIIIISTEFIRFRLLSQEVSIILFKKKINLSNFITFICMVLIDLIIYIGIYDLNNIDDFLTVLGFIFFSSVSCNLLYNYVSVRYGITGIIIYRLITILYVYFIPAIPNVYIYFRAFLRMIYPYVMYMILERAFANTDFVVAYVDKRKNAIGITSLLVIMVLITMLISCQFKYGILVIGSESMTGTINVGDAVIYESYDYDDKIKVGDIIVFERGGLQLVHRVIKIRNVDNEVRYYTKGDANSTMDNGYVVKSNIVGMTKLRLMYIGYPTLWFRDLFL